MNIVDKLGILLFDTEKAYCRKNGLVPNYDLDWLEPERQEQMKLFLKKNPRWIAEHKSLTDTGLLVIPQVIKN